jgi:hypothetical protein
VIIQVIHRTLDPLFPRRLFLFLAVVLMVLEPCSATAGKELAHAKCQLHEQNRFPFLEDPNYSVMVW